MKMVNIHEAKTKLSAILSEVEQYNVPVAELSPVKQKELEHA